jgi:hypothetical protein
MYLNGVYATEHVPASAILSVEQVSWPVLQQSLYWSL